MWIAHGYIKSRCRKSEEDIGDEYIHELDRRSFLMLDKQRWEETFTLHDLIHDLARSISMGEFCTNTTESINGVISSEAHHVYTENCSMIERSSGNSLFIRTLVNCYKADSLYMVRQNNLKLCTNNANLRVLKCEGAYACALEHMVNLKHLRYFELSWSNLERLPKSTTLLFNLVALRISSLWYLKELPVHIGKLVNLRFLSITDVGIKELPESLGQLSNLQMLYLCSCSQLKEWPICIGNLTNLKKLHISDAKISELPESFCMLHKLQTLVLKRCWNILRLPDGIGNLINLQCMYVLDSWLISLPKSINQLCKLDMLELSTRASLVGLLCSLEGILNRSSLNISIEKQSNQKEKEKQQIERNFGLYKYRKTESLLECLKPLNDLVEFKVNGIEGIGYPKWIAANYNSGVAISMQCHLNSGKFFRDLGELPSLKSLTLIGQTLGNNFRQTLTSQDVMMIFPSLEELEFNDMIELNLPVGELDWGFPVLDTLRINNCSNLSSLPKFDSLRRLEIIKCSFSKLEFNRLHLQLLENLQIEECIQLTSLHGLQSLCSLHYLYVEQCPQLMEFSYPMTTAVKIVECPSLKWWCQIKKLIYIEDKNTVQHPSLENWHGEHTRPPPILISKTQERDPDAALSSWSQIIERESDTLEFSPAQPLIENSIKKRLEFHTDFYNLEKLEIKHCWKLETLKGISELRLLRRLVLWDCPLLLLEEVPPFLMSLVIHGSHSMLSLDLLRVGNLSSLTELEITNCRRLMRLAGLRNLIKLETLAIMDCPQLLLELLFTVPDCVVISGCPRLKAWCEMHSIEPLDDEME